MLEVGDRVRLVSPAGPVAAAGVDVGIRLLESWGLRVELGRHALGRHGLFSGSDDERGADLVEALIDPDVAGVLCTRGGYGSQRLLDRIPFDELARRPKVFLGFSDITALHVPLVQLAGWRTLHGPSLAWDTSRNGDQARASLRAALTGHPAPVHSRPDVATAPLTTGEAVTGTLLGGNLAMLAAGCGTPYALRTDRSTILLLEDVNEPPYKVDRMLLQLRQSGVLDELAGIALGEFAGCDTAAVLEVLGWWLDELKVPCLAGLPVGHGVEQHVVPLGADVRIDPAAGTVTVQPFTSEA
jgi:muramoyltetrapeptide carboxypeptidase